jgi:hypothetical protein
MAQSRTTIESVWEAKGNLPDNAIVATADGKYPALDGSLITNVGAGDLLAANNLSELTATASVARTNLELGAADTVEFGGFVPPAGTTAEIDAVANAVAGQVMINSDSGQLVRFTGPATYGAITTAATYTKDSNAPSSTVTLLTSGFLEAGLVNQEANPFVPVTTVSIKTGGSDIDGENSTNSSSYFYHDGSSPVVGSIAGWYQAGTLTPSGGVSVPADSLMVFNKTNSPLRSTIDIISDVTENLLVTELLEAGVQYNLQLSVAVSDMLGGNVRFDSSYTGSFSESYATFSCDDLISGVRLGTFEGGLPTAVAFNVNQAGPYGIDSPSIGYYLFNFKIKPSSSGSFTFSVGQRNSSTRPVYVGKANTTTSALTS